MKITLAPIPFFWSKEQVFNYYRIACEWPVHRVYLGETVCSKRRELRLDDWCRIAEELTAHGKEVVLSTLVLVESRAEVGQIKRIMETPWPVEANDWTAVALAVEQGKPFYAGPSLNIYNNGILAQLEKIGLIGWTLPVELGKQQLQQIRQQTTLETQVTGFGFAPLAYSARCFTARAANVGKDNCALRCLRYPQGLLLKSQEHQPLFRINGIQTLSAQCIDLGKYWQDMQASGADCFRYIPVDDNDGERISALAQAIYEGKPVHWQHEWPTATGYWFSLPGMVDESRRFASCQ